MYNCGYHVDEETAGRAANAKCKEIGIDLLNPTLGLPISEFEVILFENFILLSTKIVLW